jgi:hypothetical protein
VDVAYALHNHSESQIGVVLCAGKNKETISSRKQKCVTKNPGEVELVVLTDNLGLVALFQDFWTLFC